MRHLLRFWFLVLVSVTVGRADVLILTKEQPWHTQVSQALVATELTDLQDSLAITTAEGKRIQIKKSLVLGKYDIAAIEVYPNLSNEAEYEKQASVGAFLTRFAGDPKASKVLAPYIAAYNQKVKPELERYKAGKIKKDGVWYSPSEYSAKLAADVQAVQKAKEEEVRQETAKRLEDEKRQRLYDADIAKRRDARLKKEQEELAAKKLAEEKAREKQAEIDAQEAVFEKVREIGFVIVVVAFIAGIVVAGAYIFQGMTKSLAASGPPDVNAPVEEKLLYEARRTNRSIQIIRVLIALVILFFWLKGCVFNVQVLPR